MTPEEVVERLARGEQVVIDTSGVVPPPDDRPEEEPSPEEARAVAKYVHGGGLYVQPDAEGELYITFAPRPPLGEDVYYRRPLREVLAGDIGGEVHPGRVADYREMLTRRREELLRVLAAYDEALG